MKSNANKACAMINNGHACDFSLCLIYAALISLAVINKKHKHLRTKCMKTTTRTILTDNTISFSDNEVYRIQIQNVLVIVDFFFLSLQHTKHYYITTASSSLPLDIRIQSSLQINVQLC